MGADLVQFGLSPFVDHYSYTYHGAPVKNTPVLFQLSYYGLNVLFGDRGGQVAIKVLSYLLLLSLAVFQLHRAKAPVWLYLFVLTLLVSAVQYRMQVRPELIGYPLMVLAFMLYERARVDFSNRNLVAIALLLLFWVNYHNPFFGYVIFFGLFIDVAYQALRDGNWKTMLPRWAVWGLILVALGLLRPGGSHFLLERLNYDARWMEHIKEFFPPIQYLERPITYLWMISAGLCIVQAVRTGRWGILIVMGIFLYGAVNMARMVVPSVVIIACSAVYLFTTKPPNASRLRTHSAAVPTLAVLIGSASLGIAFHTALFFLVENQSRIANVPEATARYIRENEVSGRIFNTYRLGGYLLYTGAPGLQVYIDGRTNILYPIEHYLTYADAIETDAGFERENDKYEFTHTLVSHTESIEERMYRHGFGLEFSDAAYSLYKRRPSRLEHLGALSAFPYCMPDVSEETLRQETQSVIAQETPRAFINPLTALVANYHASEDKAGFIDASLLQQLHTPPSKRRFIALAMRHAKWEVALEALETLDTRLPVDALVESWLLIKLDRDAEAAYKLRNQLTEIELWETRKDQVLRLLIAVDLELAKRGLEKPLSGLQEEVLQKLLKHSEPLRFSVIDGRSFCAW